MSKEIGKMSKEELLEYVGKLEKKGSGRGEELLSLLRGNGSVGVDSLCNDMNINVRNLSSIKSGLKKKGGYKVDFIIVVFKIDGESLWELVESGDDSWDNMLRFG